MIQSKFYRNWFQQVVLPPQNDYIICISASSRTPVSGTGKTTKTLGIAKSLDRSPEGFDAESQATMDAEVFGNEVIPNAPDKGAVIMEESQGTPGGGSGLNRMRAMSQDTLEAVGSVLANRDKNLTVIIVVQQLGMLFSDFYPLIDSWFLISAAPGQIGGPVAKHHQIHTEDYPDAGSGMRTPIVETVDWPAIPVDHPDYETLDAKKQQAKTKGGDSEEVDHSLSKTQQQRLAQSLRADGYVLEKIADHDMIEYSREWVRQNTTKPEKAVANSNEATA